MEYAAARSANPAGAESSWAETAVSRISFGKARAELGYSDLKVDAYYMDNSPINGKVYKSVPQIVEINAYRKK